MVRGLSRQFNFMEMTFHSRKRHFILELRFFRMQQPNLHNWLIFKNRRINYNFLNFKNLGITYNFLIFKNWHITYPVY